MFFCFEKLLLLKPVGKGSCPKDLKGYATLFYYFIHIIQIDHIK